METIEIIRLQRTRDFSRKLNATFAFVTQNFRSLVKALLYIAGPSILLVSVLAGSLFSTFFSTLMAGVTNPDVAENFFFSISFWAQASLILIFIIIGTVMTIATVNNYIILYGEMQTNKVPVHLVWERVRQTFFMYLGSVFLYYFVFFFVALALGMVMGVLTVASPFMVFFGILIFYGGIIWFAIGSSLTFFIRGFERKDFFDAFARSFKLIKNKWWSTFGLMFVLVMVTSTIAGLFIIPFYVLFFVAALNSAESGAPPDFSGTASWVMTISFAAYYTVSLLCNALPMIGLAFQYFNLVEMKESRGLISEIENMGVAAPESVNEEEQY